MAEQQEQSAYPNPYMFNAKELDREMRSIRELH